MRMLTIGISCLLSSIVLQPAYSQEAPESWQPPPLPPPPGLTGQGAPPALPGPPGIAANETLNLIETIRRQQGEIERLRVENDLLKQKIDLLEQLSPQ